MNIVFYIMLYIYIYFRNTELNLFNTIIFQNSTTTTKVILEIRMNN